VLNTNVGFLGETGLGVRTLPPTARRPIAALWFAVFAALATFLFFLRLVMALTPSFCT
jgi:hypothetical protein